MGISFIATLLIGLLVLTRIAYRYAERRGLERFRLLSVIAFQWTMIATIGYGAYLAFNDPSTPVYGQAIVLLLMVVVAGAFLYGTFMAIRQLFDPEEKVF